MRDSLERVKGLSGEQLVSLLQTRSRQIAHLQAEFYAVMVALAEAEVYSPSPFEQFECVAGEIEAALAWTRRAAENHLGLAYQFHDSFQQVWRALSEGTIDLPKARVIIDRLTGVKPEIAGRVADLILEWLDGKTTGQIAARIRRLLITADPQTAADLYYQGISDRRVVLEANPDGTANLLGCNLPADRALKALDRVDGLANQINDATRSLDQIRADVLLDLLEGRHFGLKDRQRPVIDLTVDLATLAGLSEDPGEVPGWGPVIADLARQIVQNQPRARWQATVTDPVTGQVVWEGTTRRRPTSLLRRHVEVRNPYCVFPGCRRPARKSDLDHNRPWHVGGPTTPDNLAPLCRRHHRLKHLAGWKLIQIQPGTYQWTSPHHHRYLVTSEPP